PSARTARRSARAGSSLERPLEAESRDAPVPRQSHELDVALDARLEAHRRPGGHVEPKTARAVPVERERRVRLREVDVRADLHRAVAGVRDAQGHALAPGVQLDLAGRDPELARDHWIGWCSVTSLRPSGKVASTCTSSTSSGTPSITS